MLQVAFDGGLAVAAVGGDRARRPPVRSRMRSTDAGELGAIRSGAVLDAVVEDDAVVIVGDLGLVAELDRAVDAALADRPGIGIMQADQPGRGVRGLPGQPGPGLGHDRRGPLDAYRQLAQRPGRPALSMTPGSSRPGGPRSAAAAPHRAGLRRSLLRSGELASSPVTRRIARVVSSRPSLPRERSLLAVARTRRAAVPSPVRHDSGRTAPPAACTRRAVTHAASRRPWPAAPSRSGRPHSPQSPWYRPAPARCARFCPAALAHSASFSPATAASPHRVVASSAWSRAALCLERDPAKPAARRSNRPPRRTGSH